MKKGKFFPASVLASSMFILFTGLVSAQFFYPFNFNSFLYSFSPSLVLYAIIFVGLFAVAYYSTSRVFSAQKGVAAVVALCISVLAIYGINSINGFSYYVSNIFYGIGISTNTIYDLGIILFLALIVFLFVKLKMRAFYIIGGLFLILGIIPGLIYESGVSIIIGVVLLAVGVVSSLTESPQKKANRKNKEAMIREQRRMKRQARKAGGAAMGTKLRHF